MGEGTIVRDAKQFRRWTCKFDTFVIFCYATIYKDK